MEYVPYYVKQLLTKLNPSLVSLYLRFEKTFNYALVCGIGMIINQIVLHLTYPAFPLWLANFYGIFCAWAWNYTMSVGALGYIWGLGSTQDFEFCPDCGFDLRVKQSA